MHNYFNEIVKSIQEIVRFPSYLSAPQPGAPFGEETGRCLNWFLHLAQTMGFATENFDGYAGEVVFGEGE